MWLKLECAFSTCSSRALSVCLQRVTHLSPVSKCLSAAQNGFVASDKRFCIIYLASDWSCSLWMSAVRYHGNWFRNPKKKKTETRGKKFLQNFVSSRGRLVKSTETRQGWKYPRRLRYYEMMVEKKGKKSTQHLTRRLSYPCRCRVVFLCFFSAIIP